MKECLSATSLTIRINELKKAERILERHGILTAEVSRDIRNILRGLLGGKEIGAEEEIAEDCQDSDTVKTKSDKVLKVLLERRENGQFVSRSELLNIVYGTDKLTAADVGKLKVLITRVRRKIKGAGVIVFEKNRGYILTGGSTKSTDSRAN